MRDNSSSRRPLLLISVLCAIVFLFPFFTQAEETPKSAVPLKAGSLALSSQNISKMKAEIKAEIKEELHNEMALPKSAKLARNATPVPAETPSAAKNVVRNFTPPPAIKTVTPQVVSAPASVPVVTPTPTPAKTGTPKVTGMKTASAKPAETPVPKASPTPTPVPKPKSQPTPVTKAKQASSPKVAPQPTPTPTPTPAPKSKSASKSTPKPASKSTTKSAPKSTTKSAPKPTPTPTPRPVDPPDQVRIRARILEWTHDSTVDWGFIVNYVTQNPNHILRSGSVALPSQQTLTGRGVEMFWKGLDQRENGALNFNGMIQALEVDGTIEVRSEPNIVVSVPKPGGKPATANVQSTSHMPYEQVRAAGNALVEVTVFKDVATQLTVTVQEVIEGQFVKMTINTAVTDLGDYMAVGKNQFNEVVTAPRIETRSISSTVLVADRRAYIIGVLKTTREITHREGLPVLSEIPLLGFFFRNEQKQVVDQELLFVVEPEIIRN